MMDAHILEKLRKNAVVYIKDEDGTFIPLGVGSTVSLTQDGCSAPTMVLEVQDIPTLKQQKPENIVSFDAEGLKMSMDCPVNVFWQYPPPKFGKSFVEEGKITYMSLADKLKEEEEGNNMELLRLYNKKSRENINNYYQKLLDKEGTTDVVLEKYNTIVDNFLNELRTLYESNSEINKTNGSYIEQDIEFDFDDYDELKSELCLPYYVCHDKTEQEKNILKMRDDEVNQLENKMEEINAHISMIRCAEDESYNKVMNVFKAYNVVDENGKITPYTPEAIGDTCCEECKCEEIKHRGRPKKKSN